MSAKKETATAAKMRRGEEKSPDDRHKLCKMPKGWEINNSNSESGREHLCDKDKAPQELGELSGFILSQVCFH